MRDLQWLYQQLGKVYAENMILKEELEKAQAALKALTEPSKTPTTTLVPTSENPAAL